MELGEKSVPPLIVNLVSVPRGVNNIQPEFNTVLNNDCEEEKLDMPTLSR